MAKLKRMVLSVVILSTLSACSSNYLDNKRVKQPDNVPVMWQSEFKAALFPDTNDSTTNGVESISHHLYVFDDAQFRQFLNHALETNFSLRQEFYAVQQKRQALTIANSALWPSIEAGLSGRRNKTGESQIGNKFEAGLDIRFELDLWQKLSDAEQKAQLEYLAAQASFEQAKQNLIANVITAWFDAIEASRLLKLAEQRVELTKQSLDIIERGYQQGLNEALDVYLARNDFNTELSRLSQQRSTQQAAIRSLQRLSSDYPSGQLQLTTELPIYEVAALSAVPSDLVENKPALQASWYELMAKNANLAFVHKKRYPSFVISGSIGDDGERLADLFDGSGLVWSLLGNLTAPIFNAGQLKANEETARLQLKQAEQQYLNNLYQSFETVENRITDTVSLEERYKATMDAKYNAKMAADLSFEQYQSGLVTYTTVLNAQSRAFDAETSAVQLHKQLLINQIQLQLALGLPLARDLVASSEKE